MSKNHLLCVHEGDDICRLVAAVLEDFEIISAGNTADARRLIAQQQFDLYLLDVEMSDGNGLDLCRLIREKVDNDGKPVLFLSGTGAVTTSQMEKAGAQGFVEQGSAFVEELENRVAQFLGR